MKIIEGNIDAKGLRIAIVVSRFNSFITEKLVEGAVDSFKRHGGDGDNLTVIKVPGAYEIPMCLSRIVDKEEFDGFLCLGAVIRGSTPHFDYIASETAKGIAQISLRSKKPVAFGVLTTDTIEQAIERAGTKMGNKGFESMSALLEMIHLYRSL